MISENLKKLRKHLGLSMAKFADKVEISAVTLTNYERGERTPSAPFFIQLHKNLNVNLNWLVSGVGEMFIENKPSFNDGELEAKVVEYMKKYGVIEK